MLVRVLLVNFEVFVNKCFVFWVMLVMVDCIVDMWLLGVFNVVEVKCWDVFVFGGCVY